MEDDKRTFVVGDVHGQFGTLISLLMDCGLLGADLRWCGGRSVLWLMGDLVDRGAGGLATVDLVMRLQGEATGSGGGVYCLLGNHEITLLSAHQFRDTPRRSRGDFVESWKRNGGQDADLEGLTPAHVEWMRALPTAARIADRLLIHADSTLYLRHGDSIQAVNDAIGTLVRCDDADAWDKLLDEYSDRFAFSDSRADGREQAERVLETFGGSQIIHAHTPIGSMVHRPAAEITDAYEYAGGRCVNVDGGMYMGGPGFIYAMRPLAMTYGDRERMV